LLTERVHMAGRPKKDIRTLTLGVRLPEPAWIAVKGLCLRADVTPSTWACRLVLEALRQEEKVAAKRQRQQEQAAAEKRMNEARENSRLFSRAF